MVLTLSQPSQPECSQSLSAPAISAANSQQASVWEASARTNEETASHFPFCDSSPAADKHHHSAESLQKESDQDENGAEDSDTLLEVSAQACRGAAFAHCSNRSYRR